MLNNDLDHHSGRYIEYYCDDASENWKGKHVYKEEWNTEAKNLFKEGIFFNTKKRSKDIDFP